MKTTKYGIIEMNENSPDPEAVHMINAVRNMIFEFFYKGKTQKEVCRDAVAINKAIARYGYLCHEKGWHFSNKEIFDQLNNILYRCRMMHRDTIRYFPAYFQRCIDEWLIRKAEEYSAKARAKENIIAKTLAGLKTMVSGEPSSYDDTKMWSMVYQSMENMRVGPRKKNTKDAQTKRHEAEQFDLDI